MTKPEANGYDYELTDIDEQFMMQSKGKLEIHSQAR